MPEAGGAPVYPCETGALQLRGLHLKDRFGTNFTLQSFLQDPSAPHGALPGLKASSVVLPDPRLRIPTGRTQQPWCGDRLHQCVLS